MVCVQVPNGLAWNTAKRHMYYNDTVPQYLTTYETDADGIPVRCGSRSHLSFSQAPDVWSLLGLCEASLLSCPYSTASTAADVLDCRDSSSKMKQLARLNIKEGKPDGMTIDADGNVWVALASANSVVCYEPESGKCHSMLAAAVRWVCKPEPFLRMAARALQCRYVAKLASLQLKLQTGCCIR